MGKLQLAGVSTGRVGQWVAAHEELMLLARRRSELDALEGPALLRALRAGVHRHLGFGAFAEYIERLFGYSGRTLDDKLRTAEALEELPALTHALRHGTVSWSAVRELARVATPETEREWLNVAHGRTVHEVERLVSGHPRGSRPADQPVITEQRHVLRFEVSAETFATFHEALKVLRQCSDAALDDDSALLLMAREVLGGPTDDGKSSYQVALNLCERCGSASQDARGEVIPVDRSIVEMAHCDAQHIGSVSTGPSHATTQGQGRRRRVTAKADVTEASVGAEDFVTETTADAPHVTDETHVGADVADEPHVGADDLVDDTHAGEPKRATQSIPPALRRKVMRRDHGSCRVPGCRNATFVDVHHITPRAEGGAHDENNLIVLCSAHHRALHRAQLEITGSVNRDLTFHRADGSSYGALNSPHPVDAAQRVFQALRAMGFREHQAREAITRSRSSGNTETILRQALSLLTAPAVHS